MVTLAAVLGTLLLSPPAGDAPAAEASDRVGPGDVLEVTVAGGQSTSYLATVQTTGTIVLPGGVEANASARTPAEIAADLARVLARTGSPRPVVTVKVVEYRHRSVWVRGEVHRPGRRPCRGGLRLLDVLLEAGGFTSRASGEVVVERRQGTFPDGSRVRRVHLSPAGPTPAAIATLQTVLDGDDVVTVSALPEDEVQVEMRERS